MNKLLLAIVVIVAAAVAVWHTTSKRTIFDALRHRDAEALDEYLSEHGLAAFEARLGFPLLSFLCGPKVPGDAGMIDVAVAHGADVNGGYHGDTPLMECAMWGKAEAVAALIRHGARIDTRASDGKRAIDLLSDGPDAEENARMRAMLTPKDER